MYLTSLFIIYYVLIISQYNKLNEMEGDMVVRKYEGYSGRMICGTLLERWGGV